MLALTVQAYLSTEYKMLGTYNFVMLTDITGRNACQVAVPHKYPDGLCVSIVQPGQTLWINGCRLQ